MAKYFSLKLFLLRAVATATMLLVLSCAHNAQNNSAQTNQIQIISDDGVMGRALIVYNPGYSDFQEQITMAFARGLSDADWQVFRMTSEDSANIDLSSYTLLAIGTNTYWWNIDKPTKRFLFNTAQLPITNVVGLVTAAGSSGRAEKILRQRIEDAGGRVLKIGAFWVMRPNDIEDDRPNRQVALEKAYTLGNTISNALQ